MITAKLFLPFGEGRYHLIEQIDPEDGEVFCFCEFFEDKEEGERPIKKYSNLSSFIADLEIIVRRDGWGHVHPAVIAVMDRHPAFWELFDRQWNQTILNNLENSLALEAQ